MQLAQYLLPKIKLIPIIIIKIPMTKTNNLTNKNTKTISRRDFLKTIVGILTFIGLGGITKLFTSASNSNKQNNTKSSGYGGGGYGV